MTIDSKYNIGDIGFILKDNKVTEIFITSIGIGVNSLKSKYTLESIKTSIVYTAKKLNSSNWTDFGSIPEKDIFKTKEELLASL